MRVNPRQWAAAVAVVVGALVVATSAVALPGAQGGGRRGLGVFRGALGRVGLTAEQRARIRSLVAAERPSLEALRGKQLSSKAELDAALGVADPDPAAVGKALLEVRADRQAVRAEMRKVREGMRSVLTPEQRATLDGYLAGSRAARRRGRV